MSGACRPRSEPAQTWRRGIDAFAGRINDGGIVMIGRCYVVEGWGGRVLRRGFVVAGHRLRLHVLRPQGDFTLRNRYDDRVTQVLLQSALSFLLFDAVLRRERSLLQARASAYADAGFRFAGRNRLALR
jgi:hypothetical protein